MGLPVSREAAPIPGSAQDAPRVWQMNTGTPQRIVCLSAESADWMARIGAWKRVVGVTSHYRPEDADLPPVPRVGSFASVDVDRVLALRPDLVFLFSDVQAGVASRLISAGCAVFATNPRTLAEVERSLAMMARVVGDAAGAEPWLEEFARRLAPRAPLRRRVRVYFEEWDNPLISGIGWVSEMIERAGGQDVFACLHGRPRARDRVVTPEAVRAADPEVILACWCGKPTVVEQIVSRPGWEEITAVRNGAVFPVRPELFLQPGFRLVEGYQLLRWILESVAA